MERSCTIPRDALHRFCLKGQGQYEGMFMISKTLRERVQFLQMNLCRPIPQVGPFELIFLRNVLIYFETEEKRRIVESVIQRLKPNGLLIVGHSESLNGVTDRVVPVQPTVYRAN